MRNKLMLGVFVTAVAGLPIAAHADWQSAKEKGAAMEQRGKDLQTEGKQLEKRGENVKDQGEKAESRARDGEVKARDDERTASDKLHDAFTNDHSSTKVKRDSEGHVVEKKTVHRNSDGTKTTTTTETK